MLERGVLLAFGLPLMIASLLVTADVFVRSVQKISVSRPFKYFIIGILTFTHLYFILSFSMNSVGFICYQYTTAFIASHFFYGDRGKILILITPCMVVFYLLFVGFSDIGKAFYLPLLGVGIFVLDFLLSKIKPLSPQQQFYLMYFLTCLISPRFSMLVHHTTTYDWEAMLAVLVGSFVLLGGFMWLHRLIEGEEYQVLAELANSKIDALTGCFNYGTYNHDLLQAVSQKKTVTIAMIDLDHFKKVNDRYGHIAGNELLRTFASRTSTFLDAHFAETFSFYRYGGEEFCVVIEGDVKEQTVAAMTTLCQTISSSMFPVANFEKGTMSLSCGVEASTVCHGDILAAVERADQALYLAKQSGRNRVCTLPET